MSSDFEKPVNNLIHFLNIVTKWRQSMQVNIVAKYCIMIAQHLTLNWNIMKYDSYRVGSKQFLVLKRTLQLISTTIINSLSNILHQHKALSAVEIFVKYTQI